MYWYLARLAIAALVTSACGGEEKSATAPTPGLDASRPAAAPATATRTMRLSVVRGVDRRALNVIVGATLPAGWVPEKQGTTREEWQSFVPPVGERGGVFSSSVTVSAACAGACGAAEFEKQGKDSAARMAKFIGGSAARIVADEQLRDGVWGYIIDQAGDGSADIGVLHLRPGRAIISCTAHLNSRHLAMRDAIYRACQELDIRVEDPRMPEVTLARERNLLARCPEATGLTWVVNEGDSAPPTAFGELAKVEAFAPSPGAVELAFVNRALGELPDVGTRLEGEQRVLRVFLWAGDPAGDVSSGPYPWEVRATGPHAQAGVLVATGRHWSLGKEARGEVRVVARTEDRICGTLTIEDEHRTVTATFDAPLRPGYPRGLPFAREEWR